MSSSTCRASCDLRSFKEAVEYPPNQVFIGNLHPDGLNDIEQPWYEHLLKGASRYGAYGEMMPEEEFFGLLKLADDFDLIWLGNPLHCSGRNCRATPSGRRWTWGRSMEGWIWSASRRRFR